jgi:hypothetical protein
MPYENSGTLQIISSHVKPRPDDLTILHR